MNKEVTIYEWERIDDLHRNGLKIIQDPAAFCFGIDAVLLTGIVRAGKKEKLLDLGTGNGIIPILLTAKTQGQKFIGLEIQPESVALARRSVELNGLSEKVIIEQGDLREALKIFKPGEFDAITTNPPYMNVSGGLISGKDAKAIARHEVMCTLEDVIRVSSKLLRVNGRFYMVHRPHRLTDIICLLRQYGLEPKGLRFVHTTVDKEPSMVLVEAVKGGKPMIKVRPPLIIYTSDGEYTPEVYEIYYE